MYSARDEVNTYRVHNPGARIVARPGTKVTTVCGVHFIEPGSPSTAGDEADEELDLAQESIANGDLPETETEETLVVNDY